MEMYALTYKGPAGRFVDDESGLAWDVVVETDPKGAVPPVVHYTTNEVDEATMTRLTAPPPSDQPLRSRHVWEAEKVGRRSRSSEPPVEGEGAE